MLIKLKVQRRGMGDGRMRIAFLSKGCGQRCLNSELWLVATGRRRMGKLLLPSLAMVTAECAQVGLIILSKKVMSEGMNSFIFVFFSNTLAALLLLPSSFLFHRYLLSFSHTHPQSLLCSPASCKIGPHSVKIASLNSYLEQIRAPPNHIFHSLRILLTWVARVNWFRPYYISIWKFICNEFGPRFSCYFLVNIDLRFPIPVFLFSPSYLAQVFGYAGIYYTSATLSTALLNLVPGFTFILAVAFRLILSPSCYWN